MKLHVIDTGHFKLDGGAMFGVVPKSIWQKLNPADANNLCSWAMRCLLIEDGDRLILIDTGIGTKQSAKFYSHYYLHGDGELFKSLKEKGFSPDDITDVFLTHLHFDHVGGAISSKDDKLFTTFKNAKYWSNEAHWNCATQPNAREKASFLKENILPIQKSGQLYFVENDFDYPPVEILYMNGHTEQQMLPKIKYKGKTIVFCADLLASAAHIRLPYVMGYDMRPLVTLEEKEIFLNNAINDEYILFFEHDPVNECATLKNTERGVALDQTYSLKEIFG